MIETDRFEKLEISTVSELEAWLEGHHDQQESVWLVTFKVSVEDKYVSREEVLDVLLCFGWIDGIRRKFDDDRTMQLISPRQQQIWARSYRERAEKLVRKGRMRPPGLGSMTGSQDRGLWTASDAVDDLVIPDDLHTAFSHKPPAEEWFIQSAPSYRRNVLRWIETAVRPETRAARIEKLVRLSQRGEKVPNY